jgi:methyltransferase family protein
MDFSGYDFLDFGASTGESIQFAQKHLNGQRGVGIDIDPYKVQKARENGCECLIGDITNLDAPAQAVRFVVMSHILEHLPNEQTLAKVIAEAARVARDFLFVRGPNFDDDSYLKEHGLKWYWSDWTGHSFHLTTAMLQHHLEALQLRDRQVIHFRGVRTARDYALHPLDSPKDQHQYIDGVHPPKPHKILDRLVFREFACFIRLRPFPEWTQTVHTMLRTLLAYESATFDNY